LKDYNHILERTAEKALEFPSSGLFFPVFLFAVHFWYLFLSIHI